MLYPWQTVTRSMGIRLTDRLPFELDPDRLRRDLEAVQAEYPAIPRLRWIHDGWKAIGLVAANGDINENRLVGDSRYEKTEAMAHCPTIEAFLDGLGMETRRVRLLSLVPGGRIAWHCDPTNSMDGHADGHVARVHVPIVTDPKIRFQISHETCVWRPGEAWWGDFSFPHSVVNRSATTRVHLVMDLVIDEAFLKLMPAWFWEQREARMRARRYATSLCRAWYFYRPNYVPLPLRKLKRHLIGSAFSRGNSLAD